MSIIYSMKKSAYLLLALVFTTCLNAQIVNLNFAVKADGTNSNNSTGVGASGSVEVNTIANTLELNIKNLGGSGGYTSSTLVGFGFYDFFEIGIVDTVAWTLAPHSDWTLEGEFSELWKSNGNAANREPFTGSIAGTFGDANNDPTKTGLANGESGSWVFTYTGVGNLQSLVDAWCDEDSILDDLRLRFRSIGDPAEGSDKVYVQFNKEVPPGHPVPEPTTYGLLGAIALSLLVLRRKLKS